MGRQRGQNIPRKLTSNSIDLQSFTMGNIRPSLAGKYPRGICIEFYSTPYSQGTCKPMWAHRYFAKLKSRQSIEFSSNSRIA